MDFQHLHLLVTSATFHALANVLDLKELFIRDVIICNVAGMLSLSILAGTLSKANLR